MSRKPKWSEEELTFLKNSHSSMLFVDIARVLSRPKSSVNAKAISLGLRKKPPRWTPEELEYLQDNYGVLPVEAICKHLGRSQNALKIISYRKCRGLNQKSNMYTARAVADELGVSCSKTIVAWVEKGFIQAKRSPVHCGKTLIWNFQYEDIVKCLRERPYLVDCRKMEPSMFRAIVKEEYARDPWYNTTQAAPFMGVIDHNAVKRYIYRGWLKATRRPKSGGYWEWIVRKSAIEAFLANDPRRQHERAALIKSRRSAHLKNFEPSAILKEWMIKCPVCKHFVRLIADPNATGPEVKEMFLKQYTIEKCTHKRRCLIDRPEVIKSHVRKYKS